MESGEKMVANRVIHSWEWGIPPREMCHKKLSAHVSKDWPWLRVMIWMITSAGGGSPAQKNAPKGGGGGQGSIITQIDYNSFGADDYYWSIAGCMVVMEVVLSLPEPRLRWPKVAAVLRVKILQNGGRNLYKIFGQCYG